MAAGLRRELRLVPLAAIIFFNVSGGPYGTEDIAPSFGPGLTLLALILVPLLWSVPICLVMSELGSALPREGGYVNWVERAFGRFWGFQAGWWSWINSFVDVALYPVMFVEYVRFWHPGMTAVERALLILVFVAVLTALNVAGVRKVGAAGVLLSVLALAPIIAFIVVGAPAVTIPPWRPFFAEGKTLESVGLGLAVVLWNYSGWDTASACLGETRSPERSFRLALGLALPVIVAAYVLPYAVALGSARTDWRTWEVGAWPHIAAAVGGAWMGHAVVAGGILAAAGLFLSLTLTNSRFPYALAGLGLFPASFGALHARFATPWVSVVVSAVCYNLFALLAFRDLVRLSVWLLSLTMLLELATFLKLRVTDPALPRPWRVPGGLGGAIAVVLSPAVLALLAIATAGPLDTLAGIIATLTGPAAYLAIRRAMTPRVV